MPDMDKPPAEYTFGFESDDDEKNSKKKKPDAKKIGAFTQFSLEKDARKAEKPDENKSEKFFLSKENKSEKSNEDNDSKNIEQSEVDTVEALKHEVIKEQLESERSQLEATLLASEPGTPEYAEASALLGFNQRLHAKLENPELETDPQIDLEFNRRMEEIELGNTEVNENLESDQKLLLNEEQSANENDPVEAVSAQNITNLKVSMPTNITQVGGGSINPPSQTSASNSSPTAGGGPSGFAVKSRTINSATINTAPKPEVSNNAGSGDFLLGGVVGYIIGRRGGRKRTERRLQPEINKLNTEVVATKKHLASREVELRNLASSKAKEALENKTNTRETITPPAKLTPVGEILRQTVMAPERAQIMKAVFENNKESAGTQSDKKFEKPPTQETAIKRAEQLSTPDLLKAADSLFLDGTSVRRLYDTNRINRRGLIHIVQEGIKGKSTKEAFESVELGRERQRERAREFRHDDPSFSALDTDSPALTPPLPPITPMPLQNQPDASSLQPLQSSAPAVINSQNQKIDVAQDEPAEFKQSYLAISAVLAIGVALFLLWIIFSL